MSLLIKDEKTGYTLYAVAIEYWTLPPKSAMMYLHAQSSDHARSLLISHKKGFGKKARVVGVAPAIGGFVPKDEVIRSFGGI